MKLLKRIGTTIPLALAMLAAVAMPASPASAQAKKPNIVVIMGDDIGSWNSGAYSRGMMAGRTPRRAAPPDAPTSSPASYRFAQA